MHIDLKKEGTTLHLGLSGAVDEQANFPKLNFEGISNLSIDLEKILSINSLGIRSWMYWIQTVPSKNLRLVFHKVPRIIVAQFGMVEGFLPDGATIASYIVPLYCDKCEKVADALVSDADLRFIKTTDLKDSVIQRKLCENKNEKCELRYDISLGRYTSVFKKTSPVQSRSGSKT